MQIRHITFQRGKSKKAYKFSEYYEQMFSEVKHPDTQARVQMIVDLLKYLENEVDAPPQWVNTSHFDISFHDHDCAVYGEEKQDNSKVTLHLGLTLSIPPRYSIEAMLPENGSPWHFVTGTTDDVKQASEMIREVLCKQARFWK